MIELLLLLLLVLIFLAIAATIQKLKHTSKRVKQLENTKRVIDVLYKRLNN